MLATKQKLLRRFWHAVMPVSHLDDGPKPFTLLGEPIVLWKDAEGRVSCLKDRCPHRTAKLSMGYVEGQGLTCGYHGWTFNVSGNCVRVPQSGSAKHINVPAYDVKSYHVEQRYGYLWVALDEPLTGIPELPEASMPGFRQVDEFYEPWNIGALRLMENSFDLAHVSFVHRASFGNVDEPSVDTNLDMHIHEFGFEYLSTFPVVVRGEIQQKAVGAADGPTLRTTRSNYYLPFARCLSITYPHGLTHAIVTIATPINDDNCMILQWAYRNDTEEQVPSEAVLAMDRQITIEDRAILESCDSDVPLAIRNREEANMASDRPGLVMRELLVDLLEKHGETESRRDSKQ